MAPRLWYDIYIYIWSRRRKISIFRWLQRSWDERALTKAVNTVNFDGEQWWYDHPLRNSKPTWSERLKTQRSSIIERLFHDKLYIPIGINCQRNSFNLKIRTSSITTSRKYNFCVKARNEEISSSIRKFQFAPSSLRREREGEFFIK